MSTCENLHGSGASPHSVPVPSVDMSDDSECVHAIANDRFDFHDTRSRPELVLQTLKLQGVAIDHELASERTRFAAREPQRCLY
jgi:hypothetical protein